MKLVRNKKVCSGHAWLRRLLNQDGGAAASEYGTILVS